jgi:hypothetical protein
LLLWRSGRRAARGRTEGDHEATVINVELQARPFFKVDSKYISLTKREQSVVVGLFNSARSAGCGANKAIEGIKRVHPVFAHVAKASVKRWIKMETEPRAVRVSKGKSGRPKLTSDYQRDQIKKEVRYVCPDQATAMRLQLCTPVGERPPLSA